jgi:hypothetical protein
MMLQPNAQGIGSHAADLSSAIRACVAGLSGKLWGHFCKYRGRNLQKPRGGEAKSSKPEAKLQKRPVCQQKGRRLRAAPK